MGWDGTSAGTMMICVFCWMARTGPMAKGVIHNRTSAWSMMALSDISTGANHNANIIPMPTMPLCGCSRLCCHCYEIYVRIYRVCFFLCYPAVVRNRWMIAVCSPNDLFHSPAQQRDTDYTRTAPASREFAVDDSLATTTNEWGKGALL